VPELPEVEVVRLGLVEHLQGRTIDLAQVRHPRATRRHLAGPSDLIGQLAGARVCGIRRRGKYLWLELDNPLAPGDALPAVVVHLGMSGQMLVRSSGGAEGKHLRILVQFRNQPGQPPAPELHFVDQRTFGGWALEPLVDADGTRLPRTVAHIARDPLDPHFDLEQVVTALRARRTELKRALLDQTLVSGIGNIYADEALWRAQLHSRRPTEKLTRGQARAVLTAVATVMTEALAQGGTSFDALYVNVNGASGYFDRSLHAYGQAGRACARCGTAIVREKFMNRSSFSCPRCQPPPRRRTR